MSISNRFQSTKKNKGTMTFAIDDNDWKAVKILCSFYNCSPGELFSVLIKREIKDYAYHSEIEKKEE